LTGVSDAIFSVVNGVRFGGEGCAYAGDGAEIFFGG